jgi:type I restriction enzyme, S subunit
LRVPQPPLIEGIGPLPAGWAAIRTKRLFREVDHRSTTEEAEGLLSVSKYRGVIPRDELTDKEPRADSLVGYKRCRRGDIVINKMLAWMGALGLARQDGIVSPDYTVIRPTADAESSYFAYLFQTGEYIAEFLRWSNGVTPSRWRLNTEDLGRIVSILPPIRSQRAVADFLDRRTAAIDALIAKKERLIGLLQKKRQALITQAVTKGLEPNVPMKYSGIEWLGEIPAHWTVLPVKRVSRIFVPQRDKPDLNEEEGVPWITPEFIGAQHVAVSGQFVNAAALKSCGARVLPAGSVIAGCVGRFGIASISSVPLIINQQLQGYVPTIAVDARFLRYCVQVAKPYFEMEGNTTTLAYVNRRGFEEMPLPTPARAEQERIVAWIEEQESRIDGIVTLNVSELCLLREYRQALISAAVTGKIEIPAEEAA